MRWEKFFDFGLWLQQQEEKHGKVWFGFDYNYFLILFRVLENYKK